MTHPNAIDEKFQCDKQKYYLSLGDSLLVDENFTSAVEMYSNALSVSESEQSAANENDNLIKFRILHHRMAAYLKLEMYKEAYNDAIAALDLKLLDLEDSKYDNAIIDYMEAMIFWKRVGIASYAMKDLPRYQDAFARGSRISKLNEKGDGDETNNEYKNMCKDELDRADCNSDYADFKKETVVEKSASQSAHEKLAFQSPLASKTTPAIKKTIQNTQPTMPKYQYYQSDSFVTILVLEKQVKEENLKVKFELDKLTVILTKSGINFTVICGTLFDAIDVSKCKVKIKDEKVLIKLKKKEQHNWHELFGSGARDKDDTKSDKDDKKSDATMDTEDNDETMKEIPTSDPSKIRPYSSTRDWDAIEKELKKQEKNEKPEGEEALNKLFQDIYGKADDDTRRAMIKSFQTSGGTVLSTNWNEVSKKNYEEERTAPKGMEWKNWEGHRLPQKDD